jgi:homoserine kinase
MTARADRAITAFAPASVSNLGPGFDALGVALQEPGDTVTARLLPGAACVVLVQVEGDGGRLPRDAARNTAGIAAAATLRLLQVDAGAELVLKKGMPVGSGLGSSAASAAAAAFAVNALLDSPLSPEQLIPPCVEAEAVVSGRHADNAATSVLGGLVLVRSLDPLTWSACRCRTACASPWRRPTSSWRPAAPARRCPRPSPSASGRASRRTSPRWCTPATGVTSRCSRARSAIRW